VPFCESQVVEDSDMWQVRQYSPTEVDAAGLVLADPKATIDLLDEALPIVNNWRAAHGFPLNTFQCTLRRKARAIDHNSIVVQRTKRLRAIQHKLQKHTKNPIKLSEMQDIGCRAVVGNMHDLEQLKHRYLESELKHALRQPIDDYIAQPKFSGYRGIHLVYTYNSDKQATHNGLKIEVQLRTQLQHAWATAVEIVGFFRQEFLKSSEGDHIWKHFFKLMAVELCFQEKSTVGIPGMPSDRDQLRDQLRRCADRIDALNYLRVIGQGVTEDVIQADIKGAHFFLLQLDTVNKRLKIEGYKLNARERAIMDYAAVERAIFGTDEHDAVLVSAESLGDLRQAYVNYFLDMHRFIEAVEKATAIRRNGKLRRASS
jgi:RelA/SpoT family protein